MSSFQKGDRVRYIRTGELGTIVGFSSDPELAFVLYDADTASKATRKVDLELKDKAAGVHPAVTKTWTT